MNKPIMQTLVLFFMIAAFSNAFILQKQQISRAPSYNQSLSRDYTILAVASYCDRHCLQSWTCQITNNYLSHDIVNNISFIVGTLTRAAGFAAYDKTKNLIVVSLRGSANAENWISDFSFQTVSYQKCKDCKVHVGFMEDFKSIETKLFTAVDLLVKLYPSAQILTTGHSMGAALSVIVGIQLKLKFNKVVEIQNIGCPRVGNPSFAQFVQTKVDRINRLVHNRDLVVHLPPLQMGYHHQAYQIFFDQNMDKYEICNQSGEDKNCSNKYSPQYSAKDHDFYFWDLGKILKC